MEDKKVLLSVKDLHVKFRVRGRILTAIRGISLDIYENESIAIVGESGSGKSVFTKTFAGMLDSNGFISEGQLIFSDDELADTHLPNGSTAQKIISHCQKKLDEYSKLELGSATWQAMEKLKDERQERTGLSHAEQAEADAAMKKLTDKRTNLFNLKQTFDPKTEKDKIRQTAQEIKELDAKIKDLKAHNEGLAKQKADKVAHDSAYLAQYDKMMAELKERYAKEIAGEEVVRDQPHLKSLGVEGPGPERHSGQGDLPVHRPLPHHQTGPADERAAEGPEKGHDHGRGPGQ